jgi:hypothetical protein
MLKSFVNRKEVVIPFKFNLQLFAEGEGSFPSVSDIGNMLEDTPVETTPTTDPVAPVVKEDDKPLDVQEKPGAINQEVKQDSKTNEAFKAMRKQLEEFSKKEEKFNKWAAENFKEYGVTNIEEYIDKINAQLTDIQVQELVNEKGVDEDFAKEYSDIKKENENIKKQLEEVKKMQDTIQEQKVRSEIESEISAIMELSKSEGVDITEEQLLKTATEYNLPNLKAAYKILRPDLDSKYQENIIKKYIEGLKNGKKPVEGSSSVVSVASGEVPKTFAEAMRNSKELLSKNWK